MELTFLIDQHPKPRWRASRVVFRWIRGFGLHDAGLALKPAPFTVQIWSDKDFVKGFPADSRERAEALLERLQAECASLGVHDLLVKHNAPSHFVTRAARSA
jgi:hypothetical protein